MTVRSWLYVPGDGGERLDKAIGRGADAVIADLEDAVAASAKDDAREAVAAWVRGGSPSGVQLWVRVHAGEAGLLDVDAVVAAGLTGVCVPKVASRTELELLDVRLAAAERSAQITVGRVRVMPLVESAQGLLAVHDLLRAPRVDQLQLGEVDLAADLGLEVADSGLQLLHARSVVIVASAAAGALPPPAAVSREFRDLQRFRDDTDALRRLGFVGRVCIHPAQLAVTHEVFTPSAQQVARARDVVDRFDAALSTGRAVATDEDGRMIDEAVVRSARRVLATPG